MSSSVESDRPNATRLPASDAALLAHACPSGLPHGAVGLFAPDSWLRRVSGESAVVFGGGCALLLEVAHPLVAAGVSEHSNYRTDPFGRLSRTLEAMSAMAFGSVADALEAARRVEASHERVRGRLAQAVGGFAVGTPYHGRDPELVRWVWATLVDTARAVYERFVGPIPAEGLEAYHREHAVIGRLLGVPPEMAPESRAAFSAYWAGMVDGPDLAVGPAARDIARFVLENPQALGGGRVRALTAALLPARLRAEYGLDWDEARAERIERWAAEIRSLRPVDSVGPSR